MKLPSIVAVTPQEVQKLITYIRQLEQALVHHLTSNIAHKRGYCSTCESGHKLVHEIQTR